MSNSTVVLKGLVALVAMVGLSLPSISLAKDTREFVKLPPMMQEHMLANMRDHLVALDEMLGRSCGRQNGRGCQDF